MWLDRPWKIIKEVIKRVIGFSRTREMLTTKVHLIIEVVELTGCNIDGRMCTIKYILNVRVQFVARVIAHTHIISQVMLTMYQQE